MEDIKECLEATCGFGICEEEISCNIEGNDCFLAKLSEAEESAFHDAQLIKATRAIKEVLANIPKDEKGRELSFINTKPGLLLAWVNHSKTAFESSSDKEIITHNCDKEKIAAALKLKM